MLTLFLKLILAHLIGDFLIQPYKWVKDKEEEKIRSPYLYAHVFVHFGLTCAVLSFNPQYWAGIFIITISHFIIDVGKLYAQDYFSPRKSFFIDQILHLLILIWVVQYYKNIDGDQATFFFSNDAVLITIAVLMCTSVSSIVMKVIITRWNLKEETAQHSLKDAGNFIGILERLLVFIFIITDHWEGVGFLLAAKSVFRFGDLSRAQDRKMTEYVMIGTMLSFGMAMLTGLGYLYVEKLL